jgi:hypothetical protein
MIHTTTNSYRRNIRTLKRLHAEISEERLRAPQEFRSSFDAMVSSMERLIKLAEDLWKTTPGTFDAQMASAAVASEKQHFRTCSARLQTLMKGRAEREYQRVIKDLDSQV